MYHLYTSVGDQWVTRYSQQAHDRYKPFGAGGKSNNTESVLGSIEMLNLTGTNIVSGALKLWHISAWQRCVEKDDSTVRPSNTNFWTHEDLFLLTVVRDPLSVQLLHRHLHLSSCAKADNEVNKEVNVFPSPSVWTGAHLAGPGPEGWGHFHRSETCGSPEH